MAPSTLDLLRACGELNNVAAESRSTYFRGCPWDILQDGLGLRGN